MSDKANKNFLKDTLTFLNENVVCPDGSLQNFAKEDETKVLVNLVRDDNINCVGAYGTDVPFYHVQRVTGRRSLLSNAFYAYFLPWASNQAKHMNLDVEADYFFTTKIDGCTFAAGLEMGQQPLVTHVNMTSDGRIDQPRIDTAVSDLFEKIPYTKLSLSDYMSREEQEMRVNANAPVAKTHVTVIGIRADDGWKFYFQRRNWLGGYSYRLIDTICGVTIL